MQDPPPPVRVDGTWLFTGPVGPEEGPGPAREHDARHGSTNLVDGVCRSGRTRALLPRRRQSADIVGAADPYDPVGGSKQAWRSGSQARNPLPSSSPVFFEGECPPIRGAAV